MNALTTEEAQNNPDGIYSADSIKYFAESDERNRLYRELAYGELTDRFQLKGTLLDLGAGCGGTSVVWKDLGFDVLASDLNPFFVDYMKTLGLKAKIVDATIIQESLGVAAYDIVFASGLTPQVRRVYENAVRTYESIGSALNTGGYFIFEFTIARTARYKETYYTTDEIIKMIDDIDCFELVDSQKIKACPASFYREWNKRILFPADRLVNRIFGMVQRYVVRKV